MDVWTPKDMQSFHLKKSAHVHTETYIHTHTHIHTHLPGPLREELR